MLLKIQCQRHVFIRRCPCNKSFYSQNSCKIRFLHYNCTHSIIMIQPRRFFYPLKYVYYKNILYAYYGGRYQIYYRFRTEITVLPFRVKQLRRTLDYRNDYCYSIKIILPSVVKKKLRRKKKKMLSKLPSSSVVNFSKRNSGH